MTMYLRAVALFVASTLLSSPALSGTVYADRLEFFDPAPITAPQELNQVEVLTVAAKAFAMRSWRITEINRTAGYVDAELPIRAHVARLRIATQNGTFDFEYRQSENIPHGWMREGDEWASIAPENEGDREAAHRNYVAWVDEVHRTVGSLLHVHSLSAN